MDDNTAFQESQKRFSAQNIARRDESS